MVVVTTAHLTDDNDQQEMPAPYVTPGVTLPACPACSYVLTEIAGIIRPTHNFGQCADRQLLTRKDCQCRTVSEVNFAAQAPSPHVSANIDNPIVLDCLI